ncbi:MAG: hypothetical protein LBJ31_07190 [Treponema sp.]|jgi:hypothetical protein|nr:hypothetical protein [Treponema sp.]
MGLFEYMSRTALGTYGVMILDFLLAHLAEFGVVVVLYGSMVILAHRNLEKITLKARELCGDSLTPESDHGALVSSQNEAFWDKLAESSTFPLIALPAALLCRRSTKENLKKLLVRLVAARQKIDGRTKKSRIDK